MSCATKDSGCVAAQLFSQADKPPVRWPGRAASGVSELPKETTGNYVGGNPLGVWLNLDNGAGLGTAASPYSTRRPSQNWVIIQMYAEGRYAVDFDATTLANGCTTQPPTQP